MSRVCEVGRSYEIASCYR